MELEATEEAIRFLQASRSCTSCRTASTRPSQDDGHPESDDIRSGRVAERRGIARRYADYWNDEEEERRKPFWVSTVTSRAWKRI